MINKLIVALSTLALSATAVAETDGFKISGDLAASWFRESGNGQNLMGTGAIGAGTAGNTSNNTVSVDLAELKIEKGMGDSSVVMGIGYGRVFDRINSLADAAGGTKSTLNLTNAFFAHKFGDTGLSLKLGKFESFMGHETYNYKSNMNYTHGYAFNFTMPWYLTGANLNYNFNNMVDVGLYVVNSSLGTDRDENHAKHTGVSVGITPVEGLKIKLNYLSGHDGISTAPAIPVEMNTKTMNAIVSYSFNNMMDFAFQYVNKKSEPVAGGDDAQLNSMSLYAGYKSEMFGGGLRYEMFDDKQGIVSSLGSTLGTQNKIKAITLTGSYNVDQNTSFKVEIASHSADKEVFKKDDGAATDKIMNYGLALVHRF